MVFLDSRDTRSTKMIHHQIIKTEKDIYYNKVLNRLREKDYIIQSMTCDRWCGVLKELLDTPTQMCQFDLVAIVM